jgi:2-dehydro-3-deoxyglucarate aldolase
VSLSGGDPTADTEAAVQSATDRTLAACLDAGVPLGRIRNGVEDARTALDAGYRIVRIGGDVSSIHATVGERLATLRE